MFSEAPCTKHKSCLATHTNIRRGHVAHATTQAQTECTYRPIVLGPSRTIFLPWHRTNGLLCRPGRLPHSGPSRNEPRRRRVTRPTPLTQCDGSTHIMTTYGLYLASETRKDGEARVNFTQTTADSLDHALTLLMKHVGGGTPSASNDPSHVKHKADVRRFSHNGQSYRVAPTVATTKAPTKADIASELDIATAMIAVLAKKAKLTDATLAKLRDDVIAQLAK